MSAVLSSRVVGIDAFLKKVGLQTVAEIQYKKAVIITDSGLPHRPTEYDGVVMLHRFISPKAAEKPAIPGVPFLELYFNNNRVIADIYPLEESDFHIQVRESEHTPNGSWKIPYKQVHFIFNNVDLGWFARR